MRTQGTFLSLAVISMLAASGAAAASDAGKTVQIDIAPACNYDFYISKAEADEAKRYNANLGYTNSVGDPYFGNVRVTTVFGQHEAMNWWYGQHTYSWGFQSPGGIALPDDGVITNASWKYQLITELDNPPEGGFGNPTFPLPVAKEDIKLGLATNAWSLYTTSAVKTADLLFPESQRFHCSKVNFIYVSAGFEWTVSAIYADDEVAALGDIKSASPVSTNINYVGYAENEDLMKCTRGWGLTGGGTSMYSDLRQNVNPYVRHLKSGLDVDHRRLLSGLRFASTARNCQIVVMAVSVLPYREPATLIVLK
ncbi:MAG: hypothetical protein ACOX9C_09990 [Kiritimatiellia bacterium]|jgi:hypothetical protein